MSPNDNSGGKLRRKRMRMFDITPGQHRPKLVRNGVIFAIVSSIFLYIIYTKPPIPLITSAGNTLKADFRYAADVVPGQTPVKVRGLEVGAVTGLQYLPKKAGVEVTMAIDPSKAGPVNLKKDATATLRWRTLLGVNYYVDLVPGSNSAPALSGAGPIPETQTSSQVELDQTIQPLDGRGRGSLKSLFKGFNAGFGDPGAVRGTIHATAPAFGNIAKGLPGLRGTNPGTDLPALVSSANRFVAKLATNENALAGVVDSGSTALAVTAANHIDLGSIFNDAPNALTQTRLTTARLRRTLAILNPIAQRLEPGAIRLGPAATLATTAVTQAQPVLRDLKPTLAAIRPSVARLASAAKVGSPVLRSLSSTLTRTQTKFIPFLNATDPGTKLKNFQNVGPTFNSVTSVLAYGDKTGTLAGFEGGGGEKVFSGVLPCTTYITNPNVPLQQKIACQSAESVFMTIFGGAAPGTVPATAKGAKLPNALIKKALGVKP